MRKNKGWDSPTSGNFALTWNFCEGAHAFYQSFTFIQTSRTASISHWAICRAGFSDAANLPDLLVVNCASALQAALQAEPNHRSHDWHNYCFSLRPKAQLTSFHFVRTEQENSSGDTANGKTLDKEKLKENPKARFWLHVTASFLLIFVTFLMGYYG